MRAKRQNECTVRRDTQQTVCCSGSSSGYTFASGGWPSGGGSDVARFIAPVVNLTASATWQVVVTGAASSVTTLAAATSSATASTLAKRDGSGGCAFAALTATTLQVTTGAGATKVLTSDASGNATWQVPTSTPYSENLSFFSTFKSGGGTATISVPIKLARIGSIVTVSCECAGMVGRGDNTSADLVSQTALPATYIPTTMHTVLLMINYNGSGTKTQAYATVTASGFITITSLSGNWLTTASNVDTFSLSYVIG